MLHGLAILIILLILGAIAVGILGTVFWIWMVIDCATNKRLRDDQRVVWLLVIIFSHLIGSIIYYFAGRTPQAGQEVYQGYAQRQQPYQPYQQQPYQSYQQGYQPQQTPPPAPQTSEQQYRQERSRGEQPQYEQIQVTYPEDSQEKS